MRCRCHNLHPCPATLGLVSQSGCDHSHSYGAADVVMTAAVAPVVQGCAEVIVGVTTQFIGEAATYAFRPIPPYQPPQPTSPTQQSEDMVMPPHPSTFRPTGSPTSVMPSAPYAVVSSFADGQQTTSRRKFLCCVHKDCAPKTWYYTREVGKRCCACVACTGLAAALIGCGIAATCAALQS